MFELLDDISELVYVSDLATYDLLYLNDSGRATFHLDSLEGKKCYAVLQGRSEPCPFCNNACLQADKIETWERYNEISGHYYMLKDRLIDWNGKFVRMEMAFDITQRMIETLELKNALDAEQMLMHCVRQLHQEPDLSVGITQMLRQLMSELSAERAYIFSVEGDHLCNTYEWCAYGVTPEKDTLQNVSLQYIDRWHSAFNRGDCVIIEDLESLRSSSPDEYDILAMQNIHSMAVAPLEKNGVLTGFLGVDNPAAEKIRRIAPLLNTLRYFLMATMSRMENERTLTTISYQDTLTGLYNRTRYTADIEVMRNGHQSIGVVFMDLNGLKEINDTYGHADGDTALMTCATTLRQVFPKSLLYRIGGDEFVVLRTGIDRAEFEQKTAELRNTFEHDTPYHMAMGSAWSVSPLGIDHMLMEADARMYEDKRRFYLNRPDAPRFRAFDDTAPLSTDNPMVKEYNLLMSSLRVSVSKHLMRPDFHMLWGNDYFYDLTGYSPAEFEENFHGSCAAYFANDAVDFKRLVGAVSDAFLAGKSSYEVVVRAPRKGGNHIWIKLVGTFTDELVDGCRVIYTVLTDVTEYTMQQSRLQELAYVDPVTGGRNRTHFLREADDVISSAPGGTYCMITLDIQKFKVINDLFGVSAGDRTLFHLYQTIDAQLNEGEFAARLSTDLFALLLRAEEPEILEARICTMAEAVNAFNNERDVKYYLNLAVGLCIVKDPTISATVLQDHSNMARKQVKSLAGAQLCSCRFFSEADQYRLSNETDTENRMRDALRSGEFVVYLQPKQGLQSRKVVGAEALVRWRDPKRGLIPPNDFIPLFERNGFIVDLDLHVFEVTCALLRRWLDSGLTPVPISVNMSRAHLVNRDFLVRYETIRKKYDVDASLLEIELTETLVFENPELLSQVIDDIHQCGYQCSMDDFGSGYSSLNVLKSIRVDTLKLDRAFFSSARVDNPWEAAIISVVVELARKLNMTTVAEGVETEGQADFLRSAGCDVLQGFLFSRPIPIEDFETLAFPQQ